MLYVQCYGSFVFHGDALYVCRYTRLGCPVRQMPGRLKVRFFEICDELL